MFMVFILILSETLTAARRIYPTITEPTLSEAEEPFIED